MAGNRKAAEKQILADIERILPNGGNKELYEKAFKEMSDKEFDDFMMSIEKGEFTLPIVAPNFAKSRLDVARNIEISKDWGISFYERLWIDPGNGAPKYLTPHKYKILLLPVRRQAQIIIDKISIPKDTMSVDDLTGQPTGASKGSKITYPEAQILRGQGLEETLKELLKYRGGDEEGFRLMNTLIRERGEVDMDILGTVDTEVTSKRSLKTYLTCMHLANNL